MDAEDFTSNEVIDGIQVGDTTVDIIGYVTKMSNNFHSSPSKSKFYKFVVNNGQGKEVQVIRWNENSQKLTKIKEVGKIVYISSTKASQIKDKKFNNGNVPFELILKDNSDVEVFDSYVTNNQEVEEKVSIVEAFGKINKRIMIEAYIKSEPSTFQNRDFEFIIGSVTDCFYKLEIKFNANYVIPEVKKGDAVTILGTMEQYPPGPPVLKVESMLPVQNKNRVGFMDITAGYRNRE